MAFNPGGGSSASLSGSTDVAISSPANGQVVTYDSSIAKWKNATSPAGSGATPGLIYFDEYFSGANDSAKITALNNWAQAHGSQPRPAVVFDTRTYSFNVPIKLFSGLKLIGGSMSPAREFSRSTILNWQGGMGSSMFIFPPEGQTGQSYPADGSPRDITVSYIQFQGGGSTNFIEKFDLSTGSYSGHTLWYCQFHACGFKNFNTVWWGWGTGTSISGQTHFQSIGDTALYIGGSENSIFGSDAISFAANSNASLSETPFMRSAMSKSTIGKCMITARKQSTILSVEGGSNLVIDGLEFDAQSSDPIYGAGLIIKGGNGIVVSNCSFKGVASNPASGWGGVDGNKGWIHISGGNQISFQGNMFLRSGDSAPATSYPLVYVTSGVSNNTVKWGFNVYANYEGNPAILRQSVSGKIITTSDPLLTVTTGV